MDRLRAIEYFRHAARERSFAGAARALGVSTPAVGKLIGALERDLGVVLFERTARGLHTTSAGHRYLQTCGAAIDALSEADDEMRGFASPAKGTLVVGVQHTVARGCLTAALPRFHARHPEIELDVRDVQRVTEEAATEVDVMVVIGWPQVEQLVKREIAASRFIVAAAPTYWAMHGAPHHPRDLAQHNCLSIRGVDGTVLDMWSFVRGTEREAVAVNGWLTATNAQRDVVLDLALQGHGVVRVLDWASRAELASGALVPVLQDWESSEAPPVNLVYPPQMRRVPRARAFIAFVTEVFQQIDAARERPLMASDRPAYLRRHYGKASDMRPSSGLRASRAKEQGS